MQALQRLTLFLLGIVLHEIALCQSSLPDTSFWGPDGVVYSATQFGNDITIGGDFTQFQKKEPISTTNNFYINGTTCQSLPSFPQVTDGRIKASLRLPDGGFIIAGEFAAVNGLTRKCIARLKANNTLDSNWVVNINGTSVNALLLIGNTLVIGGEYAQVNSINRRNLASVDLNSGQLTAWNPSPDGPVNAFAGQGGRFFVGGTFVNTSGIAKSKLAAYSSQTFNLITNWNASQILNVFDLQIVNQRLLVGTSGRNGTFFPLPGFPFSSTPVSPLTILDTTTGSVIWPNYSNHSPTNTIDNSGTVYKIIIKNNNSVYLLGSFNSIHGTVRPKIAEFRLNNFTFSSWNPGANATIFDGHLQGNRLYVAGNFSQLSGATRNNFGVLDTAGTGTILSCGVSINSNIRHIVKRSDTLLLCGDVAPPTTVLASQSTPGVAIFNSTTGRLSTPATLPLAPNNQTFVSIRSVKVINNKLLVCGDFRAGATLSVRNFAVFDLPGYTLNTTISNHVFNSTVRDADYDPIQNRYVIVGDYSQVNALPRTSVCAVDATTGALTTWAPSLNGGTSDAVLCHKGRIYITGNFSSVNGSTRNNICAFSATSSALTSFIANHTQTSSFFSRILRPYDATRIIISGYFSSINGVSRTGIAIVDDSTGAVSSINFNVNAGGAVRGFARSGNRLIISGIFNRVLGQQCNSIAIVNLDSMKTEPWFPQFRSTDIIDKCLLLNNTVYAAGNFNNTNFGNGIYASNLAVFRNFTNVCAVRIDTTSNNQVICKGTSVQLLAKADSIASPVNYIWMPQTGLSNSTINNPVASPLVTTVYRVIAYDNSFCSDTAFVTVEVEDTSNIQAIYPEQVAPDSIGFLQSIGANNPRWTLDSTQVFLGQGPHPFSFSQPGEYSVEFNSGNVSCNKTIMDTILVDTVSNPSINMVSGYVFNDLNQNGVRDSGEVGIPNVILSVLDSTASTVLQSHSTDSTGFYNIHLPSGKYVFYATPPGFNTTRTFPGGNGQYTVPLLGTGLKLNGFNFGFHKQTQINPSINLTQINFARPGFLVLFRITVSNYGTEPYTGTATLQLDPAFANSGPHTFTVTNLQPGAITHFGFLTTLDSATALGDTVYSYASLSPVTGDVDTTNNADVEASIVTGAYDPNDKRASSRYSLIGTTTYVLDGEWLEYTIRFQNTGTDTAFNVEIRDTLPENLNLERLEVLSFSHPMTMAVRGLRTARFIFKNILLPDSNRNEPASHGYVKFRIPVETGLACNTSIVNQCGIYFDFNAPVITEPHTAIVNPTPTANIRKTGTSALLTQPIGVSATIEPGFEDAVWNFGQGAIPATAVGAGPHTVYWTTPGKKYITLVSSTRSACSSTKTDSIVVESTTANAPSLEPVVSVRPNPAVNGVVNLELAHFGGLQGKLKVFNSAGAVVFAEQLTLSNQIRTIRLEGKGIFILQVESNGKTWTEKVFVP